MSGETDLAKLLGSMRPALDERAYCFCTVAAGAYRLGERLPKGLFVEDEGVTLILEEDAAGDLAPPDAPRWACITLAVHSSLEAVGFIAAISGRLAQAGLSVNPVSAYFHDHLFVPWERREEAMAILRSFQQG
ncbi:ACT domain-containing protein [Chloroflexia bacterium SDU3-3]|nr:ACT domain-containing protein [Chloroflexia bacterium SDU3-3]